MSFHTFFFFILLRNANCSFSALSLPTKSSKATQISGDTPPATLHKMSGNSAPASSQQSSGHEVQTPIDLSYSLSARTLSSNPLTIKLVSTRTRSEVKTRTTIHPETDSEVEMETSMEGEAPSESQGIIPACEELDTSMNANILKLLLQKHRPSCRLVIPSPGERCHRFDNFEPDQAIPSAVFSATVFRMEIPSKTTLKGHSLERAQEALRLSAELGYGASLLTDQNLKRCGFLSNKRSMNLIPTEDSKAGASNRIAVAADSIKGPGSCFNKKPKPSTPRTPGEGSSPLIRKFFIMAGNQIPEGAIAEWDKMSLSEAAKTTTWCQAQCFFHTLKRNEEMTVAARSDQKSSEKVNHVKTLLKVSDDEKKKLAYASKKLKASEAKPLKERDQLNTTVINIDAEKDALKASYTKKVQDFKKNLDSLNTTIALERSTREAAKREKFEVGYSRGVNDYIESTCDHFPSLDWTLLGDDAVKMVEEIKKKEADAAIGQEKIVQLEPEVEAQGAVDGTSLEVQMEDVEKADPAPDQDAPDSSPDNPAS
ncbi:hypothetical protein POM88_008772 [Heracleum sosnowskyi]|uniref:Uncharacterized protein n=1 Tax=Heracleum sosnowskyi TaxID=360622 RepID=A0AAD8J8M0_9APIA|nr:hypothetical protein POM88_008772 [Heracleum sosnowskyi]